MQGLTNNLKHTIMTIELMYEAWQDDKAKIKEAKDELRNAKKKAELQEQRIYAAIYEKRDSHLKHYKEYTIQSGHSVFSFEFTEKSGSSSSIVNFKKIEYLDLD